MPSSKSVCWKSQKASAAMRLILRGGRKSGSAGPARSIQRAALRARSPHVSATMLVGDEVDEAQLWVRRRCEACTVVVLICCIAHLLSMDTAVYANFACVDGSVTSVPCMRFAGLGRDLRDGFAESLQTHSDDEPARA